jgi:hypothetical protein
MKLLISRACVCRKVWQLNQSKDIYIFAYYDWDNAPYPFSFTTDIKNHAPLGPVLADGLAVQVAVFDRVRNEGTIVSRVVKDGLVTGIPDGVIDAIMVGDELRDGNALGVVTTSGLKYGVRPNQWHTGTYGIRPKDGPIHIAGWVFVSDVRRWPVIPKGDTRTHYRMTLTPNKGVPASKLRSIDELSGNHA